MSAKAKLTEVKTAMLLNVPFFASLLLDMMKIKVGKYPELFPPGCETMATNGRTIWIDEDFIQKMKLSENVFAVCHEVGHAMWQHMGRGKTYADTGFDGRPFMPIVWNFAGDFVINDMLVEGNIGKIINGALHDPKKFPYTMLVDEVYRKLIDEMPECPKCGGSGQEQDDDQEGGDQKGEGSGEGEDEQDDQGEGQGEGEGEGEGEGHGQGKGHGHGGTKPCQCCQGSGKGGLGQKGVQFDTHVMEQQVAGGEEAEWKRAIMSARDTAKSQGKMPASLERIVDQLLDPQVHWSEKLRKALTRCAGRDTTNWRRPNRRRLVTQGVVMPTYNGFGAGHIVFVVDTSGSMSTPEMSQALGECDSILVDCNPEKVTLIGCDAKVDTVHELQQGDTLQGNIPPLGGGGGTSFVPPFKWIEEQGYRPATLVYFTDMMGTFPEDPGYPVIWCNCYDDTTEAPFGETVFVEMKK